MNESSQELYVLSHDKTSWIELSLKLPKNIDSASGAAYMDGEIYVTGGGRQLDLYKLDKNMKWRQLASAAEEGVQQFPCLA